MKKEVVKRAKAESWRKFSENMREKYKDKFFYRTLKQMRNNKEYSLKNIKNNQVNIITKEVKMM